VGHMHNKNLHETQCITSGGGSDGGNYIRKFNCLLLLSRLVHGVYWYETQWQSCTVLGKRVASCCRSLWADFVLSY